MPVDDLPNENPAQDLRCVAEGMAHGRLDLLGAAAEFGGTLALHLPTVAQTRVSLYHSKTSGIQFHQPHQRPFRIDGKQLKALMENRLSDRSLVKVLQEESFSQGFITQLACLKLVVRASGCGLPHGIIAQVDSKVPTAKGFSHRPSLLIASLRAYANLLHYRFPGTEIAQWSATVESLIWQANASFADHLTAAFAQPHTIQPILCRPGLLLPAINLPPNTTVAAVGFGSDYRSNNPAYLRTRTAAFIGKYLLERELDHSFNYISQIAFAYLTHPAYTNLPEALSGKDFTQGIDVLDDPFCQIVPDTVYPVRDCLSYPILEKRRAERILELLLGPHTHPNLLTEIGSILFESHRNFQNMGLSHPMADRMVDHLLQYGSSLGIHGARSSANGTSAAVVVLLQQDALPPLHQIAQEFLGPNTILTAS